MVADGDVGEWVTLVADGWMRGSADVQPVRRSSTRDGGVTSVAVATARARDPGPVSLGPPPQQLGADDEVRRAVMEDEGAVGKLGVPGFVESVSAGRRLDPLRVEPLVDRIRADVAVELAPERGEARVVLTAAESAGPMARGERSRLVQEEQLGELAGLQQRGPVPATELQATRNPALYGEAAADATRRIVEAAAVPVHEPAGRVGDELSQRRHAILERHSRAVLAGPGSCVHLCSIRYPHVTGDTRRCMALTAFVVLAFIVLIGPLAVLYGVDSRVDERRDGWPATHR